MLAKYHVYAILTMSAVLATGCSKEETASYSPSAKQFSVVTEKQPQKPLVLVAGQSASGTIPGKVIASDATIKSVGILIGTYTNTADGEMQIKLCSGQQCSTGNAKLSKAKDNEVFNIRLEKPLSVTANGALKYTVMHKGGEKPVALWIMPVTDKAQTQSLINPEGSDIPGMGAEIHLMY